MRTQDKILVVAFGLARMGAAQSSSSTDSGSIVSADPEPVGSIEPEPVLTADPDPIVSTTAEPTGTTIDPEELAVLNAAIPSCAIECIIEYASALGCDTDFSVESDTCICQNGATLKTQAADCLDAACSAEDLAST